MIRWKVGEHTYTAMDSPLLAFGGITKRMVRESTQMRTEK